MPDQRLPKPAYQAKTPSRRPRSTWEAGIMEVVCDRGVIWRNALASVADRIKSRTICQSRRGHIKKKKQICIFYSVTST